MVIENLLCLGVKRPWNTLSDGQGRLFETCVCLAQVSPSSEWNQCGCCIRRRISFHTWDLWHTGPWPSVLKANWGWPTLCYQIGTAQRGNNYTVIPVKRWRCTLTGTSAGMNGRESGDGAVEMTYRWLISIKQAVRLLHRLRCGLPSHADATRSFCFVSVSRACGCHGWRHVFRSSVGASIHILVRAISQEPLDF